MKRILITLLLLILFSCTRERVAGDPNSSETENVITATLIDAKGLAASHVQVYFIDDAQQMRDSVWTDAHGVLRWMKKDQVRPALYAQQAGEGIYISAEELEEKTNAFQLQMQGLQPYVGYIANASVYTNLCLQNTPVCASMSAGRFEIAGIPQGRYQTRIGNQNQILTISYEVEPLNQALSDSGYLVSNTLLLDDFEDGDPYGLLHSWNQGSHWWLYHLNSNSTPDSIKNFATGIVADSNQYLNKVLQIQTDISVDSVGENDLVLLGLNLAGDIADSVAAFVNLSEFDSLSFWIKSTAPCKVFAKAYQTYLLGDEQHLYISIPSTYGQWQRVAIMPDDWMAYDQSLAQQYQLHWSDISNRIGSIVFQFNEDGNYSIDNLEIHGITVLQSEGWSSILK